MAKKKQAEPDISLLTTNYYRQLLVRKKGLTTEEKLHPDFIKLENLLSEIVLEQRSKHAAKKLSEMAEEERRMLLMYPEEQIFFLEYKKKHPENPWGYYKEYQKKRQDDYEQKGKLQESKSKYSATLKYVKKSRRTPAKRKVSVSKSSF